MSTAEVALLNHANHLARVLQQARTAEERSFAWAYGYLRAECIQLAAEMDEEAKGSGEVSDDSRE